MAGVISQYVNRDFGRSLYIVYTYIKGVVRVLNASDSLFGGTHFRTKILRKVIKLLGLWRDFLRNKRFFYGQKINRKNRTLFIKYRNCDYKATMLLLLLFFIGL